MTTFFWKFYTTKSLELPWEVEATSSRSGADELSNGTFSECQVQEKWACCPAPPSCLYQEIQVKELYVTMVRIAILHPRRPPREDLLKCLCRCCLSQSGTPA